LAENPEEKPCITILENGSWPDTDAEKEIAKKLKELDNQEDNRRLEQLVDEKILERRHDDNKLNLKAGDRVGSAQFEMFRLNIIPKVFTKTENIWGRVVHWIDYAEKYDTWRDIEDVENEFERNNERTLVDGIILCLVGMCNNLLRRGLLKAYKTYHETIPMLRGKMAIKEQILLDARLVPKFACEFDELDYDNMENRILLHTLHLCAHVTKWNKVKKRIFGLVHQLESLQVKHVNLTKNELDKMERSYTRLNSHYRKPHSVCRQIIDKMAIADFYRGDVQYTVPIFVSMPKTFEGFVERLFEDYTGDEINVEAQKNEKAWTSIDGKKVEKNQKPDIVLRQDNKPPEIVDMKYKKDLDADDLYQLGFYMHELNKDTRVDRSFAIMPKYNKEKVGGPYKAWNTGVQVYEKHINLDDFSRIIYGDLDDVEKEKKLKEMVKKLTVTTS
jgi:5-methylcytosine-specific restriction endonuclease McrBC regulatory subunit McrC